MATILDVGILSYFTPVFVFLLIFAIVFAILEKTRILGKNKGLNSLVAFVIAMLFILTPELIGVVKLSMPWFILLLVLIVFIVVLFLFVGVKAESITEAFLFINVFLTYSSSPNDGAAALETIMISPIALTIV